METTTTRISVETKKRLKVYAATNDTSMLDVLELAISLVIDGFQFHLVDTGDDFLDGEYYLYFPLSIEDLPKILFLCAEFKNGDTCFNVSGNSVCEGELAGDFYGPVPMPNHGFNKS